MTQQERDIAIKILNNVLPPFRRYASMINSDAELSDDEKYNLYSIVLQLENSQLGYEDALNQMVDIVSNHVQFVNYKKNAGSNTPILHSKERMPFLVKQVLFFICYKKLSQDKKFTLVKFQKDLASRGLRKTKKFLNVGGLTPDGYYNMKKYNPPKMPCLYKGQKKNELAYAIKNLAYQAGAYSYYIDVFGGSGAATTAIYLTDKLKQVYNEINPAVYNLFEVLASDQYMDLKAALKKLQDDLKSDEYTFSMPGVEEFRRTITIADLNAEEQDVLAKWGATFEPDKSSLQRCYDIFRSKVFDKVSVCGDCEKRFGYDLRTMKCWNADEFSEHLYELQCFAVHTVGRYYSINNIPSIDGAIVSPSGDIVGDSETYASYLKGIAQVKALIYFLYFKKISNDETADKVQRAVGEIFLRNLSTMGMVISSAILGYDRCELDNLRKELYRFANNKGFDKIVENFHARVKKCSDLKLLRNGDFTDVFKEFSSIKGNKLYYCDSPYLGTSDYDDEQKNVKAFTEIDMQKLIQCLKDSGERFIFSMRAVGTGKSAIKRKKITQGIYDNVYNQFQNSGIKNLHVLCIMKSDKSVITNKDLIETYKNGVSNCEIMVTNFQIVDLQDWKTSKKAKTTYKFKAYKWADFMHIIGNVLAEN